MAFFPCLFLGQAYFDNDLLAQFGPWRAFLRDQLSRGRFPLWNPYLLGGQPFFADLQNMMLYPFNYLTLPFSVPYGLSVFFFIHMVWAALGMHLWLRSLGLTAAACRVGALLFAFSGFFWLELIHPPVLAAFAWLPWLFLFLEESSRNPRPRAALGAGLAFALLFLCGSLQVSIGAFYGGAAYFLFRFFCGPPGKKGRAPARSPRSIGVIFLFLLWGSLPLLGQFIPTLEFSALTSRGSADSTYDLSQARPSLDPGCLYQWFFPRWSLKEGTVMADALQEKTKEGDNPLAGDWGYLGVWAPFLALGAWKRREKTLVKFLSIFSILAVLLCFGRFTPWERLLCGGLPGLSLIRVPFRYLYLYLLPVCALAALGWDQWFSTPPPGKNILRRLAAPLVYGFALYGIALLRPSLTWREIAALTLGLAGFLASSKPGPFFKKAGSFLLQAALFLPLLLSGWADFKPAPSSNFDYAGKSRAIVEAAGRGKPYRICFFNNELLYPIEVGGQKYLLNYPQDAPCALRIKAVGGYDPLLLKAREEMGTLPLRPFVQLNAIGGLLFQKSHGPIPGFQEKSLPPYVFYEAARPPACAFAPSELEVVPNPGECLARLQEPDFDAAKTAVFSAPLPASWVNGPSPVRWQCRLERDEPDAQSFSLSLDRDRVMVFPETSFPGWKAWVDGLPAPWVTADHLLRALYVKAGRHRVEFKFQPSWWVPLKAGLLLWLGLTLLGFLLPRLLSRRPSHA